MLVQGALRGSIFPIPEAIERHARLAESSRMPDLLGAQSSFVVAFRGHGF